MFQEEKTIRYYEDSIVAHDRKELFLQNLGSVMKLPPLKSSDGLEIRVWLWGFSKKYVINISKEQAMNKCSILEFNIREIDGYEYVIIHNEIQKLEPTAGWNSFFSSIEKYKILTLKSGKSFEEQTDVQTGMSYVQFEILQSGRYHFFEYAEPSYYRHIDAGSKNVYHFLKYFEQQMSIHIYPPLGGSILEP